MDSTQVISLIIIYTFQAADYCGVLVRIHWSHNYEVFSFQSHNGKMLMGTFEKNMEVAKEVLKKYLKTKMIEKCGKDGNWFLHSRTYVDKLFASMCNKAIIKWADIQNNQGKCPLSLTVLDITRNLIQRLLLNNRVWYWTSKITIHRGVILEYFPAQIAPKKKKLPSISFQILNGNTMLTDERTENNRTYAVI